MFQGTGKGMYSLAVTILRTVILTPAIAWLLAVSLGMGLEGVWWGLVIANIAGSTVSYVWAKSYIRRLKRDNPQAAP
jgi:Na+-driven multidrug efflux pump